MKTGQKRDDKWMKKELELDRNPSIGRWKIG